MSTRNLDALLAPKAIALIGASNREGAVGAVIARNLLRGGFGGALMMVNPRETKIDGALAYKSVDDLPQTPDLAVIATPAPTVPGLIEQLGARGCRAAIVISAGLNHDEREAMFAAARPRLMRIVGPNCLGLLSPRNGVNASFSHLAPLKGDIAFLTQSGAIATSIIDWANGRGIGFSHIVSLGDMSDVDFGDLLDYLALDASTRAILLYIENATHARKFMSAARIAARAKPVIVVKSGRGEAGARAAASHTGALAGSDIVYEAAFRRAGMLRVKELRELFDAAETLASGMRPLGERLSIVTNGGGLGVMAVDALEEKGLKLAPLPEALRVALDAALPAAWSHNNPIDILGDAHGDRYAAALDALAKDGAEDAVLVMNCPTGVADNIEAAAVVLQAHARNPRLPMLACWMGEATAAKARKHFAEAHIPSFDTPEEAVNAFVNLVEYARNQAALLETPPASPERLGAAREEARALIKQVLAENRLLLTEFEAKRVLALYGVPVVETLIVKSPQEAAQAAAGLKPPFALKILSREITHKTDVGGVALGLADADAVKDAAERMLKTVAKARPDARIDGFTLQPMIRRPHAQELILGMSEDATFGPIILFGQGGIAAEVVADRVVGLPPLNAPLARGMIARTRIAKLLGGYRDRPPADLDAVANALVAIADLVIDIPEIAELDVNPLLADEDGVIALDARIVVKASSTAADARLAIRPYPKELTAQVKLPDGASFRIRAIEPSDANAIMEMARRTKPEHLRLRFHGTLREVSREHAARLTQIDYDREMALVAAEADGALAGVARLVIDPDFDVAEYAIIVRSDTQGHGLGRLLLSQLLDYARQRGVERVWGDVLPENTQMLALARELGATSAPNGHGMRTEFSLR
ncbi:MAG: bifunctional acetate--CoA ligase family protein/GNAT family N-acetyltransferase [Hyphomonadaceae bacterium]|nr:bifunctional acetate--CoA ligase family protein/GNAT family N-acetyltransferase [Hyphomonadaceae bacterium]